MNERGARLGPFVLRTLIGRGGMGEVWLATHAALGIDVAVKLLKGAHAGDPWYLQVFREEILVAAGLDHPGIVAVLDFGEATPEEDAAEGIAVGAPWVAMELVEGRPLNRRCGKMSWSAIHHVLRSLLDALAHAHARGVVHRDIKPGNVLLAGDRVKLTDFGLARRVSQSAAGAVDRFIIGTLGFMSPEQLAGEWRDHGAWTDLYALGCLAYALISGEAPQAGLEQHALTAARLQGPPAPPVASTPIPDGVDAWILRLLEPEPRDRFSRAADALRALDAVDGQGLGSTAARSRSTPERWRTGRLSQGRRVVGAGLSLYGVRSTPVVGREVERDHLWRALRETESLGSIRVVTLRGPRGSGKSRLGGWLCERAHEVGAASWLAVTHDRDAGPGAGLGPAFRRHLRCGGLDRQETQRRVSAWLRERDLLSKARAEGLTELLHPIAERGRTSVRFGSAAERYETARAGLEVIASERPVILWIDDAQWGLETLAFVSWLMDAPSPGAVLIVLAIQSEALAVRAEQTTGLLRETEMLRALEVRPEVSRISLESMDPVTHRALIRELLGLDGETSARIEAQTQGDPLFAVQLVQALVERGELESSTAGYRLKPGVRLDLPDDLHQIWAGRVIRLLTGRPRSWQTALELAAALGQDVDGEEWRAACAEVDIEAPRALVDEMRRQHLTIAAPEGAEIGWRWVHEMLRASVLRRARGQRRLRAVNLTCAQILSERGAPAERSGRHLLEAGERDRGLLMLLSGVRDAIRSSAPRRAASALHQWHQAMAGRGASDPLWGQGWLLQGHLCLATGSQREAAGWIQQAEREARRRGWSKILPEADYLMARLSYYAGDLRSAIRRLRSVEASPEVSIDLRGRARAVRADALMQIGERDAARRCWRSALDDCKATRDLVTAGNCLMGLGFDALSRGERAKAQAYLERARGFFEQGGSRTGLSACLNTLGEVARSRGALDSAGACYTEALALAEAAGASSAIFPRANLGVLLSEQGRFDEARRALNRTRLEAEEQGRRALTGVMHICLLPSAAASGDWSGLRQHLQRGREILIRAGSFQPDVPAQAIRAGEMALKAGRLGEAADALSFAADQLEGLGRSGEARAQRRRVERLRGE